MKKIILMGLLIGSSGAFADMSVEKPVVYGDNVSNIKDFAIDCTINAKVTSIANIQYSEGLPPQGRFNGIAPSLTFTAFMEVIDQTAGCSVLTDKYEIFFQDLTVDGSKFPAVPDHNAEIEALVGQTYEFKLKQNIGYQDGNGDLPLFPSVHYEQLDFELTTDELALNAPLNFDSNWVYQIKKIENMTDIEKLALAEKDKKLIFRGYDFNSLFLQLEPTEKSLKKSYAELIWSAFNDLQSKQYFNDFLLQFNVGGDGTDLGAPLAEKFNSISHINGLFSSTEIVQLLTDYPEWIMAGSSENQCLNLSKTNLEKALENINSKLYVLTTTQRYLMHDAVQVIAGAPSLFNTCVDGKVSDHAKQLAQGILSYIQTHTE